ncbi:MAG: DUF302 domain-containing protein [Hyphomicrobiaceae bacterium]
MLRQQLALRRSGVSTIATALALALSLASGVPAKNGNESGIVTIGSAYPIDETIDRLKKDVEGKGIVLFQVIDQHRLARAANIELLPSTLLVFGNPALGAHFITAEPTAGLDWPVRVLVHQDAEGRVWASFTDFHWIARRHRIENRKAEFDMATKVVRSILSSVAAK